MKARSGLKFAVAVCCLQLLGCNNEKSTSGIVGSEDSLQGGASGKITYDDSANYEYDIGNFTNADWLFEQYFGQYGVPEEMKTIVIEDLKLLANGFALQYAKGEDVQASMQKLDGYATLAAVTGGLELNAEPFKGDSSLGPIAPLQEPLDAPPEGWVPQVPMTDEIAAALKASEQAHDELMASQLDDVARYGLPYVVEDSDVQYYTIDRLMDKDGSGGSTTKSSFGNPAGANWWHGDIAWIDASKGYVNHVGIVSTASSRLYVIDSSSTNPNGGVYLHTTGLNRWADDCGECSRLEMLTLSDSPLYIGLGDRGRSAAVNYALAQVGDPYSYVFTDKTSTSSFYCSKLVWQAWRSAGHDLAPAALGAVTPNDIRFGNYARRSNYWTR